MGRVPLSVVMQRGGVLVREKHYTWSDYEPIVRTAQPHQRNHSLQQHNVDRRHHGWQPLAPLFSTPTSFKLFVEPTLNLMHHNSTPVHSSYKSIKWQRWVGRFDTLGKLVFAHRSLRAGGGGFSCSFDIFIILEGRRHPLLTEDTHPLQRGCPL